MSTPQSLLVFFDYEGTLGTSIRRHYVQYVEALRRIRKRFGLLDLPELVPISEGEFLERLPVVKQIGKLLPCFNEASPEARIAQAMLQREHSEIIWEYNPEHMLLEEVIPGNLEALDELCALVHGVVVSYTRQDGTEFEQHLKRLGIVSDTRVCPGRVYTVGADGKKSRTAKADSIKEHFSDAIKAQQATGATPLMVADSTDDMSAAFDCGLAFVGVCETGKASEADFLAALEKEKSDRSCELSLTLFPTLSSTECIRHIKTCAKMLS